MNDELHTIDDAAAYFKVHEQTVRGWLKNGTLTGFKAGRDWRFTNEDFAQCMERLRTQTSERKPAKKPTRSKRQSSKNHEGGAMALAQS